MDMTYSAQQKLQRSNYTKWQTAPIKHEYRRYRYQNRNYYQQWPTDDLLQSQQQQLQPYSQNNIIST